MVYRLLQEMEDDDQNSVDDLASLKSVCYVNILVFCFVGVIFEISRPHLPRLYTPRRTKQLVVANRIPGQPTMLPLGWLWQVINVTDEEFLRMSGLDAYMFMRFIKLCINFAS